MLKGAIFDLDGTILDSMSIWDTIAEEYLRSLGKEPRENLKETFQTFTLEQVAHYYREKYGIALSADEIILGVNKMAENYYTDTVPLKPGVKAFLEKLKNQNIKMCIATVTDKHLAEAALNRLGVREYFSEIFTCASVGHSKQEPHIYREARKHLGTAKGETVVFEDALYALQTAKSDGFITVGVFDIHEENQAELKATADGYIENDWDFHKVWSRITPMRTALTIAGNDSSGGAGIGADMKTMTMHGVYAMSAITALTAQNTTGVRAIQESTPEFLQQQIDAVFEDIFPDSVKIGMVSSSELVCVIADRLKYHKAKNIVVDPVMVATSGSSLMKTDAVKTLTEELLPIATLLTPNIPEAEVLSELSIESKEDMQTAAKTIGDTYGCAVLLKGGHNTNDANDLLYAKGTWHWFAGKRIDNPNTHGTGCTLSSAITANLAKGFDLTESVQRAKDYISGALSAQLNLGKGAGPMMHNFDLTSRFAEEKISDGKEWR